MKAPVGLPAAALAAVMICLPSPPAFPRVTERAAAQFPTTAAEAIAQDEAEVGKWADGPMSLFILDEEKEIWDDLQDDDQRRRFIGWFWARRDDDLRDNLHPIKMEIYERVAETNKRFTQLPRGWRTDRGRVWVLLGQPTTVRSDFEDENTTWNYFAPGLQRQLAFDNQSGELNVYFSREPPRKYRIAGGVAPGAWPAYVIRVMDFVRHAMVTYPDMEWSPGS